MFNLYVILNFKSWKKILKIFFLAATRLNLEKKHILAIFHLIFQKIDIISDVIIPAAAILKIFFYHFLCNITKYDCAKFHIKSIFLSGFTLGALCVPLPSTQTMMRQEYPGQIELKTQKKRKKKRNFLLKRNLYIGISVVPDIRWKSADVSRTEVLFHMILFLFFGPL